MANKTSHLDQLTSQMVSKEPTANGLYNAMSSAAIYGARESNISAVGFVWAYFGGVVFINGVLTTIANGQITLTGSTTNYVEANPATGTVSSNTSAFTPGYWPLYTVVTSSTSITNWTDYRFDPNQIQAPGRLVKALSDVNYTLIAAEARNEILEFTGTLTAQRNVVLPLTVRQRTVFNNTTGGFGLQFIGATGTGIVVAAGKRAIIYSDGTNIVRVTADQ